jgi:hypothetical protein
LIYKNMSRVSFKEFSAGLPVTRQTPAQPKPQLDDKGNVVGRALSDIPSDIVDTFKGVIGAGRRGSEKFAEAFTTPDLSIPQRVAGAVVAPLSALVNAGGEAIKGGAKLLTTEEFEASLSGAIGQVGEKIMSTDAAKKAVELYDSLPEDQKYTLSSIIAPMANVMTAGVGGIGAKPVLNSLKEGLKQATKATVKETVKRTPQEAAEAVVRSANPTPNPVVDTISGAAKQVTDFAKRTVNEAQDTAATARRLNEMPEPKSNLIRKGADERIVNVMEGATPEEIKVYRELIEQAKAKEIDPTPNTPQPKATVKETVKRTPQEAAEAVVRSANPTPNPVVDTISGAAKQVTDFAKRTVNEAQDTAATARRLNEMPEPKSNLIRKGADERIVNVMEGATPEEIKVYRELIEQAKAKEIDPTPNTPQPKAVAGREFLKPVDYIITERKSVGKELGEYRKNLSTVKDVDTNPAFQNFHTYLKDNFKVKFDKKGQIIPNTGTLAASDVKLIQKIYNQLRSDKKNSQAELDQWLQRTYKDYDLVQAREKTFSEEVPRIAEKARSEVRALMPEDYNKLATDYAQLSRPLNEFVKLLGYKGNLDDLTAKELKTGEIALRVLGNAADRPQSVIDDILETATDRGFQSNVDLNRLIYITDQLEDLYDITPSRGFSGSATRGINKSDAAGVIGDAATMNIGGLFNRAMGSRATQKEIQAAFEEYVKYLDEGGEVKPKPGSFKKGEIPESTPAETVAKTIEEMITKAPEAKSFIDGIADSAIAGLPDVKVAKAPIKSKDRAIEKIMNEEGGDATQLRDLARNSIVPMTPEGLTASLAKMDEVLAKAEADGLYTKKKIQTPEKFSGYGGVIYNIETPNGLIAEIQVVEPRMIFGKMLPEDAEAILGKDLFEQIKKETGVEPGYGHKLYEQLRDLSIKDLEGEKGQTLIKESVDYYNKLR